MLENKFTNLAAEQKSNEKKISLLQDRRNTKDGEKNYF